MIKKILAKYDSLMRSLSQSLVCPCCKEIVKAPFYNLGAEYHWSEGCKRCYDLIKQGFKAKEEW